VTLLETSRGLGELSVHACVLCCFVARGLSPPFGTVPTCSFYSLKEVQGYKTSVRGVIFVEEGAHRPREGLIW
jgi:hypothetical protein